MRVNDVRTFLYFVGAAILVVLIWLLLMFVFVPLVNAARVYEKTLNADNVIFNYEWFKLQYHDYLSLKAKIEIAEEEANGYKQSATSWTDNHGKYLLCDKPLKVNPDSLVLQSEVE